MFVGSNLFGKGVMSFLKKRFFLPSLFLVAALALYTPAVHAEDVDDVDPGQVSDPLEGLNRAIYSFNHALDVALIKPIAKGYEMVVPSLVRKGVHNVITNLSEPVTLVNAALQGDQEQSFTTFWRFTINTTYGLGGIFDVAKDAGLKYRKEDFGQTEGVYGVGQGAYLMLPLFGPSNTRDLVGMTVDIATDPFNYVLSDGAILVEDGVVGLDKRTSILDLVDHIESTSLDPYATIRSLYTQKRFDDIRNGKRY